MANSRSAAKRARTSERNRLRNKAKRSKLATIIKKLSTLEKEEELYAHLRVIYRELDRAPRQVLSKNKASRMKSQCVRAIRAKLGQAEGK